MEENKSRLEVRNTKKEPECINQHSSSNKIKPTKDYHILSEKYSLLNNVKNVGIGIAVAVTLLINGWIELDNRMLQLLAAVVMAVVIVIMVREIDEIIMEE